MAILGAYSHGASIPGHGGVPGDRKPFSVASDLQIKPVQDWKMVIPDSRVDFERKRVVETFGLRAENVVIFGKRAWSQTQRLRFGTFHEKVVLDRGIKS